MLRRYLITFFLALLFVLTQQGLTAHEISHISDIQQSSQKQDKTTHTNFCEKCLSFSDLGHGLNSKHFSIALSALSVDYTNHALLKTYSITYPLYSARAPPLTPLIKLA